jgi:CheY-like chemotaxis protein
VLLVEDNADAREMLRTLLTMDGHEVAEAGFDAHLVKPVTPEALRSVIALAPSRGHEDPGRTA